VADPQLDTPVSLGTTIMAVQFDGGVVLAADSRTSTGTYVVNRSTNKLTKLTKKIYCCRSGSAADTQSMAEMASHYLNFHGMSNGADPTVSSAATLLGKLCYWNRWNIQAGIIVAGWDEVNGGSVYNVPLGGALIKQSYAMGGSGSVFLYGWADANYKSGMNKDQCVEFVRTAVAHAISRDGSSGGMIRTMAITKDGEEHTATPWKRIPYCMEKDPEYAKLAAQNQPIPTDSKQQENVEDSADA
jgi:20S proteasome subunit beta 1